MTGRSSHKKKKLSFDRHTASTQGCVSTANSYLTKCPKASHAICSMLLQMSSNVFCSTLKLQGSSGSQRISSIIRNAEKPTGRKGSPFFLHVSNQFFEKQLAYFWEHGILQEVASQHFSHTKNERESYNKELRAAATSAILHQTLMAVLKF